MAIEKQLIVREEIVLTNRAHEHVEEVIDTVWRTEVEIERSTPTNPISQAGSAEPHLWRAAPAVCSLRRDSTSCFELRQAHLRRA